MSATDSRCFMPIGENVPAREHDEAAPVACGLPDHPRAASRTGSALAAAIAHTAEREYQRWRPSTTTSLAETDPAATPILRDYYRTGIGMDVSEQQLQNKGFQKSHPWSSVFVSWVMKTAGAGDAFIYSPAHQSYIRAAHRNRLARDTTNPFWAFRPTEIDPQVGDVVCRARDGSGATFENIAHPRSRKVHCDIVTAVLPGKVRVVGGNVGQSVGAKTLRTRPDGRLCLDDAQSGYFAIIRCNDAAGSVSGEIDGAEDQGLLAQLVETGLAAADEAVSLIEAPADVALEEFGGSEHKSLGDVASRGMTTAITYGSPPRSLSFGDVVALAGDYFGDFYELMEVARSPDGRTELDYARWHCLGLKGRVPMPAAKTAEKPIRQRVINRYFRLASRNLSHFNAGGIALPTYVKAHADALVDALDAGRSRDGSVWQRALAKEAFADHYLTDMFAAGHVRTERAAIKQWYETHMPGNTDALVEYLARFIEQRVPGQRGVLPKTVWYVGWVKATVLGTEVLANSVKKMGGEAINAFALGDIVSLAIHDYDNKGLDVVSATDARGQQVAGGYRWTAVGDGHLGVDAKPGTRRPEAVTTAEMATAAIVASLRDLERVREIGRTLGGRALTSPEKARAIRNGVNTPFGATRLIPHEDRSSHRNVVLGVSTSKASPLDWRWGRLGKVAYQAVDDTVRVRIASELKGMIDDIDDAVVDRHLGVDIKVTGLKTALAAFTKHLQATGVTAMEQAVGRPAR